MIRYLKDKLFPAPKINKPKVVIHDSKNNRWGEAIHMDDDDRIPDTNIWKVHGWLSPTVEDGDVYAQSMGSGRSMLFRLSQVRNCDNPQDMFFAEAEAIGYWDELTEYPLRSSTG